MNRDYNNTEWKNGFTRVNAKNMNNIENGIKTLYEFALETSQIKEGSGIKIEGNEETGDIEISQKIKIVKTLPDTLDEDTIYYVVDPEYNLEQVIIEGEAINIKGGTSESIVGLGKSEYSGIFRNTVNTVSLLNDTYFIIPENKSIYIKRNSLSPVDVLSYIEEKYQDVVDGDLFTLYVNYTLENEKFEIRRISEETPGNCFPVAKILYWYNTSELEYAVNIVFTIPNN